MSRSNELPNPIRDAARLAQLGATNLLDTPSEAAFDRITRLAARFVRVPVALVSLVDDERQFFKSCVGLPEPWDARRETPLIHSLCRHVVATSKPLAIIDAHADPRVEGDLAIPEIGVGAYLGIPITINGQVLGSFCAIDTRPRAWTDDDVDTMTDLAQSVASEILYRTEHREVTSARKRLQTTLASIGDGVITTDAAGAVTFLNPVAEHLTGWSLADARGVPLTDVFRILNETTRATVENPALRALQDGVIVGLANHTILIARDGVERPIDDSAAPIRNEEGVVSGAVLVFRDITERKQSEIAQARLAAIVESSHDAIIGKSLNGIIQTWNGGAERIFGYAASEAIGQSITLVIPPDRLDEERNILGRLRRGERVEHFETQRVRKDGRLVDLSLTISPIRDAEGQITGASKVARDVTDARRAERILAASRARLDYAVRTSGIGFWYCDLPFGELQWDERVKSHFGLPPDARVTIDTFYDRLHPDDREPTRVAIERSVADRTEYDVEYRTVDPTTKDERWIRAIGRANYDEAGTPTRFDGVTLDVTERRRTERRLEEGERQYRELFESIDEGFCVVEVLFDDAGRATDYRFLKVNPVFERQTGLHDVVGKRMRELAPDHDEHWFEVYGRVAMTGKPIRFQDYAESLGRHFDVYAFPTGEAGARTVAMLFRDVTDRKRAEESVQFLADASASLAELVDYQSTLNRIANLAVAGFADWCVVDLVNEDGTRERLAVTASEADELTAARRADLAFRPTQGTPGMVPHVLRTGEAEVVSDIAEIDPATAPQGPERLASLHNLGIRSYLCVPLRSRGRVIGGMTFLSSSTRRRFGPEELRVAQNLAERVTVAIENAQLYQTLQEQDRRKDEFLATLAHELRNPLAPIRNGLQILRMDETDDESAQTLSIMDRQLGHITHLVDDLMDVARVSSGKIVLRPERVPLRSIVDTAVETSRQAIETGDHEFGLRMPRDPLVVEVDRTRLVQILANLLNNAAKYTPQGGRISLGVARDDEFAVIKIADTGVGIPPEMLPKVFEMFTQVGTSLERSQGGLGIGLTLVKRLVEMHGGSVRAESPGLGQGSTFIIRIPLAAEAASAAPVAPKVDAESSSRSLDILVVDDNRDAVHTLARLLRLRGHQVKTAHDGPEALRLLETFRPALILLDLGLPGMSGYEVARRIRESTELRGVTLAALTGWGQEEDRRRTREAGFDHHLTKPVEFSQLAAILVEVPAPPNKN